MGQQFEDVISDDDDAFLNRYVYICFERDIRTRLELTEVPRDRNPKDIVPLLLPSASQRAPPAGCH
jgi:hypothetical protein